MVKNVIQNKNGTRISVNGSVKKQQNMSIQRRLCLEY